MAYRNGSLNDIRDTLRPLNEEHAKCARKSISFLALQERQAEVLEFFLDEGGFPYESYFEDGANRVKEGDDPDTFRVLEESRFRVIYPRGDPPESPRECVNRNTTAKVVRIAGWAMTRQSLISLPDLKPPQTLMLAEAIR